MLKPSSRKEVEKVWPEGMWKSRKDNKKFGLAKELSELNDEDIMNHHDSEVREQAFLMKKHPHLTRRKPSQRKPVSRLTISPPSSKIMEAVFNAARIEAEKHKKFAENSSSVPNLEKRFKNELEAAQEAYGSDNFRKLWENFEASFLTSKDLQGDDLARHLKSLQEQVTNMFILINPKQRKKIADSLVTKQNHRMKPKSKRASKKNDVEEEDEEAVSVEPSPEKKVVTKRRKLQAAD